MAPTMDPVILCLRDASQDGLALPSSRCCGRAAMASASAADTGTLWEATNASTVAGVAVPHRRRTLPASPGPTMWSKAVSRRPTTSPPQSKTTRNRLVRDLEPQGVHAGRPRAVPHRPRRAPHVARSRGPREPRDPRVLGARQRAWTRPVARQALARASQWARSNARRRREYLHSSPSAPRRTSTTTALSSPRRAMYVLTWHRSYAGRSP